MSSMVKQIQAPEYYRFIVYYDASNLSESSTELGLLLWPQYPVCMQDLTIVELLGWVRGLRPKRKELLIQDLMFVMKKRSVVGWRLKDLSEDERKWLSDELIATTSGKLG